MAFKNCSKTHQHKDALWKITKLYIMQYHSMPFQSGNMNKEGKVNCLHKKPMFAMFLSTSLNINVIFK